MLESCGVITSNRRKKGMMVLYTGDTAGGIQVYLIVKVQENG